MVTLVSAASLTGNMRRDLTRQITADHMGPGAPVAAPYESVWCDHVNLIDPALQQAATRNNAFQFPLHNGSMAQGATLKFSRVHIYVLSAGTMSEWQGPRDLVVVEKTKTHAHIMVAGLTDTKKLQGLAGFSLPLDDMRREVQSLANSWRYALRVLKTNEQVPNIVATLADAMKPLDWDLFDEKFSTPGLGDNMLQRRLGTPSYTHPSCPHEKFASGISLRDGQAIRETARLSF